MAHRAGRTPGSRVLEPLLSAAYAVVAPDTLRVHYFVGGTADGPNDFLGCIDVGESDDEVFVKLLEDVLVSDRFLARLSQCVDFRLRRPLDDRVVRDGNAPRDDERRGRRLYMAGGPVPRVAREGSRGCEDWTGAPVEVRSGPQKWPLGTSHYRLLRPPEAPRVRGIRPAFG